MSLRRSPAWLLVLLVSAPASAGPAEVAVDFAAAPSCAQPLATDVCLAGHDSGPGPGLGDDTFYVSTVVERAAVDVDGAAGVPAQRLVFDYDETYYEHPIFVTLEGQWNATNDALPEEVRRSVRLRNGTTGNGLEGMWIIVLPGETASLPVPVAFFAPVVVYWPHVVERERVYPLNTGGTERIELDEAVGLVAFAGATCRPEEQALVPAVCAARGDASMQVTQVLMDSLPNVGLSGGVQRAEVSVGDPAVLLAASVDPSKPTAWTYPLGVRPAHVPSEASGQAPHPPGISLPSGEAARPLASASLLEPLSYEGQGAALDAGAGLALALAAAVGLLVAGALYRRLRSTGLLEHPARRRVLDLVGERPGITVAQAAEVLGSDYKTAQHHVDILVEAAMVSVHLVGRQRRLFPATRDFDRRTCDAVLAQQRPGAQRLLAALQALGPLPRCTLYRCSGLSRAGAWENLRALEIAGVVAVEGQGRAALVRLAPPGGDGMPGPAGPR